MAVNTLHQLMRCIKPENACPFHSLLQAGFKIPLRHQREILRGLRLLVTWLHLQYFLVLTVCLPLKSLLWPIYLPYIQSWQKQNPVHEIHDRILIIDGHQPAPPANDRSRKRKSVISLQLWRQLLQAASSWHLRQPWKYQS